MLVGGEAGSLAGIDDGKKGKKADKKDLEEGNDEKKNESRGPAGNGQVGKKSDVDKGQNQHGDNDTGND